MPQRPSGPGQHRARRRVQLERELWGYRVDPADAARAGAVDRILNMLRTVVNVTGDATVATVVAASEGQLDLELHGVPVAA